ncbi:tRNA (adenine(22)-N(1))-methyltransferase [Aerococcaceae bacterium WGS1372]
MNSNKLSKRLEAVAEFTINYGKQPIRLADIGSDHAYLPCNLVLNQHIEYAIAGEVVSGPYESAKKEVSTQMLADKIDVRFGDGLNVVNLNDLINVVTICGMGGILIRDILDAGHQRITSNHLLVLQPNMAEYQLRNWLNDNNYYIIDESIITEHKHHYEIIVAQHEPNKPKQNLTDLELFFGPVNLNQKTKAFQAKWEQELESRQRIADSIKLASTDKSDKLEEIEKIIKQIKEIL